MYYLVRSIALLTAFSAIPLSRVIGGGGGSRNGRVEGEAAIQSFVVSTPIVLAIDLFFQVLRFSSQHSVLTGVDCGVGWPSMAG